MCGRSAYPLNLNGLVVPNRASVRRSISSEPSFISYRTACEAPNVCASPTFLVSGGHSAFPDQRIGPISTRILKAENPLLCPPGAESTHFARNLGIVGCNLQISEDLRLYGGPSRERTILHRRIPSTNPNLGPISHAGYTDRMYQ